LVFEFRICFYHQVSSQSPSDCGEFRYSSFGFIRDARREMQIEDTEQNGS